MMPTLESVCDRPPELLGIDTVVHLAGKAHVLGKVDDEQRKQFQAINHMATRRLAESSISAGVRRFVLISTIGVHGDRSLPGQPIRPDSPLRPFDAYSRSKLDGEYALQEVAAGSGMDVVIVRPPLVYGPDAPGNFRRLVRLVQLGVPLPLGSLRNLRSMIARENLVDFIVRCITHEAAADQAFVVRDSECLSTPDIIREIASGLRRPARLFKTPPELVERCLAACGQSSVFQRLAGFLEVDSTKAGTLLNWSPPIDARSAIREAAHATHL